MKYVLRIIFPAICVLAYAGSAEAQTCSTDESAALKSCVDSTVSACRTAVPECKPYEPVLTIADVVKLAVNTCCGKSSKNARKLCLIKESKKYLPAVASGSQRDFFKEARAVIKRLRVVFCKNNDDYQVTTSAALF